jgi:hypothetical protein
MINFRNEQQEYLENGFNFYPLTDKNSFGFVFRFGKKLPQSNYREKALFFRYSKHAKKWFICIVKTTECPTKENLKND